jgi:hypothetical protein
MTVVTTTAASAESATFARGDTDDARDVVPSATGGVKSKRRMRDAGAHAEPSANALPTATTASSPDGGLDIDYGGRN